MVDTINDVADAIVKLEAKLDTADSKEQVRSLQKEFKSLEERIEKLYEVSKFKDFSRINKLKKELRDIKSNFDSLTVISEKFGVTGASSINKLNISFKDFRKTLDQVAGSTKVISLRLKEIQTAATGLAALQNKAIYTGSRNRLLFGTQAGLDYQQAKYAYEQASLPSKTDKLIEKTDALTNPLKAELLTSRANLINDSFKASITQIENSAKSAMDRFDTRLKQHTSEVKKAQKDEADALKKSTSQQDAYNKAITRATTILPTYQLAIMANYAAINKIVGGFKYLINYTVQYDEQLHQLQAISATTTGSLKQMQSAIESVAASTEFTSLELTKASVVLAQAGLSATQIEGTLPAIAKLATATGTDLNTSVETITSTLNIYNLQTSEAEHVTNALTTAMNESKANIGGFQQAIQYAGNLASQLGISFDETAAAISAAAQAGIRSKSMLGTGMRATLTEMLKPTKKFKDELESVGLTIDDIDVKSKGYVNVLKTLKEAGFGAEEAFRGLDRRAAAFLVTQINQVDFMQNLRQEMASSTAASKANEVQMESLAKQYKTFQNNLANAATNGLEPFVKMLSNLLSVLNKLMDNEWVKGGLGILLTGGLSIGGLKTLGIAVTSLSNMFKTLKGAGIKDSLTALSGFSKVMKEISKESGAGKFASFFITLAKFTGPVGIGVAAISLIYQITSAMGLWKTEQEKLNEALEKAKGEYDEAKNKLSGVEGLLQRVYDQREKLQDQSERDIFVQEIITKYPEISKYIDNVAMSYEDLIETVKKLNILTATEAAEKSGKEAEASLAARSKRVTEALGAGINWWTFTPNIFGKGEMSEFYSAFKDSQVKGLQELAESDLFNYKTNAYGGKEFKVVSKSTFSEAFEKTIVDIFDNAKKISDKELKLTMAEVKSSILKIGNKELIEALKVIEQDYQSQIKKENDKEIENKLKYNEFLGKNTEIFKEVTDTTSQAWKLMDEVKSQSKNQVDVSKETVSEMEETLKNLIRLRDNSALPLDPETGELKVNYGNTEALAKQLGVSADDIYKAFEEFMKQEHQQETVTLENYQTLFGTFQSEFISYLNEQLNSTTDLTVAIAELTKAINKQGGDANTLDMSSRKYYSSLKGIEVKKSTKREDLFKDLKTIGGKAITSKQQEIATAYGKDINALKIPLIDTNGNIKDKSIFIDEASKSLKNLGFSEEGYNKALKSLSTTYDSVTDQIKSKIGELGAEVKTTGPKFDSAAESLKLFFNKLDSGIKDVEASYRTMEGALDRVLAKQEGVVEAYSRFYGSGSLLTQAAQIDSQKLSESQLEDRIRNRTEALRQYEKLQVALENNSDYQAVTSSYEKAQANWEAAVANKDWSAAAIAKKQMDQLSGSYRKYSEENLKLTKTVEDLRNELTKYKEIQQKLNDLANKPATEQLTGGMKAGAEVYVDSNKQYAGLANAAAVVTNETLNEMDSQFTTMFTNIIDGSQKAGDAFKSFGKAVLQTMRDVAIQMAVKQGMMALFGSFGSSTTDTGDVTNLLSQTKWGGNAQGGLINGPVKNRDSVPTMLMPGEYVMKKSAVDTLGRDYLDNLNSNASATLNAASESISDAKTGSTDESTGAGGIVNVYVVGQEQQQSMTPNDVLVTITQDMLKGGQTKRLVKSIAMGSI